MSVSTEDKVCVALFGVVGAIVIASCVSRTVAGWVLDAVCFVLTAMCIACAVLACAFVAGCLVLTAWWVGTWAWRVVRRGRDRRNNRDGGDNGAEKGTCHA